MPKSSIPSVLYSKPLQNRGTITISNTQCPKTEIVMQEYIREFEISQDNFLKEVLEHTEERFVIEKYFISFKANSECFIEITRRFFEDDKSCNLVIKDVLTGNRTTQEIPLHLGRQLIKTTEYKLPAKINIPLTIERSIIKHNFAIKDSTLMIDFIVYPFSYHASSNVKYFATVKLKNESDFKDFIAPYWLCKAIEVGERATWQDYNDWLHRGSF